jgi:hypothetical protein
MLGTWYAYPERARGAGDVNARVTKVPLDKPKNALAMLNTFLSNGRFY